MQSPVPVNNTISEPYINCRAGLSLQKLIQIFQIPNPNAFSAYSKIQSRGPKWKNWPTQGVSVSLLKEMLFPVNQQKKRRKKRKRRTHQLNFYISTKSKNMWVPEPGPGPPELLLSGGISSPFPVYFGWGMMKRRPEPHEKVTAKNKVNC